MNEEQQSPARHAARWRTLVTEALLAGLCCFLLTSVTVVVLYLTLFNVAFDALLVRGSLFVGAVIGVLSAVTWASGRLLLPRLRTSLLYAIQALAVWFVSLLVLLLTAFAQSPIMTGASIAGNLVLALTLLVPIIPCVFAGTFLGRSISSGFLRKQI